MNADYTIDSVVTPHIDDLVGQLKLWSS